MAKSDMQQPPQNRPGTLSPLAYRLFAILWTASLVSNLGNAIQGVGASWLMISIGGTADKVALVQAAVALPIMLFALFAGAIADLFDRRRVILAAQSVMVATAVILALLARSHLVSPWLLLALTFLLGTGAAFSAPSIQASIGDLVPREELAGAVSLNILGFNVARSVGPALGGAIVALGGAGAAFLANAATFLCAMLLILVWRPPARPTRQQRESVGRAVLDGLNYVAFAPAIRMILVRALAFTLLGSAAWALMPLIARDLVGGGPRQFGWLLGGLGLGAVIGALASTRIRARFTNEVIVRMAGVIYGTACVLIAMKPGFVVTLLLLVFGGAGWVQALSGFSVTGQIWSPRWVVGRVAATINSVMYGGIALGSWAWGHAAERFGVSDAIAASGAAMIALLFLGMLFRLPRNEGVDLDPVARAMPEAAAMDPRSGPIVVTSEYRVSEPDAAAFAAAMGERRRILRRDGARRWTLLQDVERRERWVERYQLPSWADCLRHHLRGTSADVAIDARVRAFNQGQEAPATSYLVARHADEGISLADTNPELDLGSKSASRKGSAI